MNQKDFMARLAAMAYVVSLGAGVMFAVACGSLKPKSVIDRNVVSGEVVVEEKAYFDGECCVFDLRSDLSWHLVEKEWSTYRMTGFNRSGIKFKESNGVWWVEIQDYTWCFSQNCPLKNERHGDTQ